MQDLIDHQTFEAEFAELAKGMPDLERIVSRIHAKNCKMKDFLKVLAVSILVFHNPSRWSEIDYVGLQKAQHGLEPPGGYITVFRFKYDFWFASKCARFVAPY